jgi:hypothetical protein
MQYIQYSTNYILLHGIIRLGLVLTLAAAASAPRAPGERSISAGGSATPLGAGSY